MKIIIDINHPAHVHYFRNFYKIMTEKGHIILVISRNKEIEHHLLRAYNIPFIDRGKGRKGKIGKAFYFFWAIFFIIKFIHKFEADIIMSFGTPYPAIAGWLCRIPHISFNDTEHAKMHHMLTDPFSRSIVTPYCYNIDLGYKQIKFKSIFEFSYLFSRYYSPNKNIKEYLNLRDNEKYVVVRFVSWNAVHDIGENGLSEKMREKIVFELLNHARVFISSESEIPEKLRIFQIKIPAHMMHDVLASASLFIGESPTMTTESTLLGTPAICISSWACDCGNFTELSKNLLLSCFLPSEENLALELAKQLIINDEKKTFGFTKKEKYIRNIIDTTAFMVWFIENYPESAKIMKENPDYQDRFK